MMLEDSHRQSRQESTAFDGGRIPPNGPVCAAGGENAGVDIFTSTAR
jgi:hypothetical protein